MKLFSFLTASGINFRIGVLTVLLTITSASLHSQLSGTKTIGSGGDYASFTAAVTALTSQGVSGAVTFNVLNGTYTEQIEITSIAGANSDNTITFQSQSGNAANVTLTFTPTSTENYVVQLLDADYMTFQNMTLDASSGTLYGGVVKLGGDADNNRFLNNIITGVSNATSLEDFTLIYGASDSLDNTTIDGNQLNNGSYGVQLVAISQEEALSSGTVITNNILTNQSYKGISLFYHNGAHVNGNTISTTTLNVSVGIEVTRCDSALQVLRNKITVPNQGYGINLYACLGGAGNHGLTANNFVTSLNGNSIGLWVVNCTYQDIYHNSVNIIGDNTDGQALSVAGTADNVNIVNNIFANHGGGYSYSAQSPATGEIAASNYNDLYTMGANIAYWDNADVTDLAALRSISGRESNSISVIPSFYSSTNLHVYSYDIDSAGTPLAAVTTDIDGELRDLSRPDIGADEFVIAQLSLNQGWNMVSVPVIAHNFQTAALFPGVTTSAFAYQNGSYAAQSMLANELGYWVRYGGASRVSMTGGPITSDTFNVTVGWNLIGSISNPVPVTQITSTPGGMIASQFFGYDLFYTSADTIKPGKAYWVKVNQTGQLNLSSTVTSSSSRISIVPTEEFPPSPPGMNETETSPPEADAPLAQTLKPETFALHQNYPNPFNPLTVIRYQLPVESKVTIKIFNILGYEVTTLVNEVQEAGYKSVQFDAARFPSGVYFYKLSTGSFIDGKKMMFIR